MSEEKKEGCCTSSSGGCSCCSGKKFLIGLVVGALLFAAGMCIAKNMCQSGGMKMCPMERPAK